MFNHTAKQLFILFEPGRSGNFLKNCFTLSKDCADSSYSMNANKLKDYTNLTSRKSLSNTHYDKLYNFSVERFRKADRCIKYVHCGHFFEFHNIFMFNKNNSFIIKIKNDVPVISSRTGLYNSFDSPEDAKCYSTDFLPDIFKDVKNTSIDYSELTDNSKIIKIIMNISDEINWEVDPVDLKKYVNWYFENVLKP